MAGTRLEQIKGNYWISRNAEYVVLVGKMLWIFKVNGDFVACRKDIPNAFKVAFLPGDRVLTGSGKSGYHLLSLRDGSDLWSMKPHKYETCARRFALSPDGAWAYDFYYWKGDLCFVKIDLDHGETEGYIVSPGLCRTTDILCDEDGIPCLLQANYSIISGKQVSENGILYQYQDVLKKGSAYYWKYKWQFNGERIAKRYLGNTDTVITNDLYVYHIKTGDGYYLLENDMDTPMPALKPHDCCIDESGRYIILEYSTVNIVVDWNARKVVSYYAGDFTKGCLVGDEFWVSTKNGIVRKPFPLMEEIPPERPIYLKIKQVEE